MRRHFLGASAVVLLSCALAHAQAPPSTTPVAVEQSDRRLGGLPTVIERDGRLTLKASETSLSALLLVLSEKTGVKIFEVVPIGHARVSIDVNGAPIEEILRQVLSQHDAFFFYGRTSTSNLPASLQTVWVYPRGRGSLLAPIDATTAVGTTEFIIATSDPNPTIRMEALEQLVERTDGEGPAAEALIRALEDPEEMVRMTAIDAAVSHGVELPDKQLEGLAVADASPHVRLRALKALVNSPQIRQVAEAALVDGNADVRDVARTILEALDRRKGGNR